MKQFWLKVWHFVKNKYVAATLIFLLIFLFLGENNVRVAHKLKREVSDLNKEKAILENDLRQDSVKATAVMNNLDSLEAYGRETYYMKRDNEDIFIIKD